MVAFSGKVKLPDDDTEYSEASINGFPEDRLTKEFDKDEYQVLLVANKYQTGFDQPKLCAMYVLKKLKGVSAVQTLSRLNRICPPFEKKTFVLDFVNTYEDIKAAFAPYYTTTLLSTSVTPTAIYDLEAQIDAYTVLDPDDIEKANELLYKGNISSKDKQKLTFYFKRAKNRIEQYELIKQHEIVSMMRHFVRFYWNDLRLLKETVRNALNWAERNEFFSDAQDSTSCLTAILYFEKSPDIKFKFDVAITTKNKNGNYMRLIHNKNVYALGLDQYTWNEVPNSHQVKDRADELKKAGLWQKVRDRYLEKKNMYLFRQDHDHPSFVVYVEAVNEVYNRYFNRGGGYYV